MLYEAGLSPESEAVISDHFMHRINQDLNLVRYHPSEFSERALCLDSNQLMELIESILTASEQFIIKRALAAKNRARKNFKEYGYSNPSEPGVIEFITEVMFDRQFLKGPKTNCSRLLLAKKIKVFVEKEEVIKLIIPALPYKSSSPLKTRGTLPDLAEINFLLGLAEIVKTMSLIYKESIKTPNDTMATFIVISDGLRFNTFLNEPQAIIKAYQEKLRWWINRLNLSTVIEILDYQFVIENYLSEKLYLEKKMIREKVCQHYSTVMNSVFNPQDMLQTISKAIRLDPDPESCNAEGRFIPLFKSLIYTIRYKTLIHYTKQDEAHYQSLYSEITRHLFEPYTQLTEHDLAWIKASINHSQQQTKITQIQCYEYLRQAMLQEVWLATIKYIAEIRSDRDLAVDPISSCFVDYIRWTIHAKSGQMAILTTTAAGDPIQPWHGVGMLKLTKNKKIKIYTQPILLLEGEKAIPVIIADKKIDDEFLLTNQPFFYIHQDLNYKNTDDLMDKISKNIIKDRKS